MDDYFRDENRHNFANEHLGKQIMEMKIILFGTAGYPKVLNKSFNLTSVMEIGFFL